MENYSAPLQTTGSSEDREIGIQELFGESAQRQIFWLDQSVRRGMMCFYHAANVETGSAITLKSDFGYLPFLENRNTAIPLFEFVETIDEIVDYDQIKKIYPDISYSKIKGAIDFLRKISQFNLYSLRIDEFLENGELENVSSELINAVKDEEVLRVLSFGQ